MLKTLVAIEVDLASSFAIRYACDLGNLIPMELYPVYVKAPPPEVPVTGTGWVRHTWEREIVAMGKEEIQEMLASEQESCPMLQPPRVIYGDRDYELAKIESQEAFDLYVEGAPYPFNPANIQRRLHAKFYQKLPCPLIWLRGLRSVHQALVVCPDLPGARAVLPAMQKLWAGCSTPLHLALPPQAGHTGRRPPPGRSPQGPGGPRGRGLHRRGEGPGGLVRRRPGSRRPQGLRSGGRAPPPGGEKRPCPP